MQNKLANKVSASSGASSLGHMPAGSWKFDESVTAVFDDMLARSVPQIQAMRETILHIAGPFVKPDTHVVDLGCSRGESIAQFISEFGTTSRFLGLELAEPMLAASRERFKSLIEQGVVEIRSHDLTEAYPSVSSSVTLSILTLMFTPVEVRQQILCDVLNHTISRGAVIVVEKVLAADSLTNNVFRERYEAYKRSMGYTQEEITRKRLSLEGLLVPLTAKENEQLLVNAGFRHVECFWRCLNFCGWIAIKAE